MFGTSGRVDFWIKFLGSDIGWAVELLRDGDRAENHLARFASGGSYHCMPASQKAVIDFYAPNQSLKEVLPGMVYVFFEPDFAAAFVHFPDGHACRVDLVA